jgi:hypothetical protein
VALLHKSLIVSGVRHRKMGTNRHQEATRIAEVLAERFGEVVPPAEFAVEINGSVVGVLGIGGLKGNSYRTQPIIIWLLPFSTRRRLRMLFESQGYGLQGFLTRVRDSPWPATGAQPYVTVTDDMIKMWWGGSDEDSAVVMMRPIFRRELGV